MEKGLKIIEGDGLAPELKEKNIAIYDNFLAAASLIAGATDPAKALAEFKKSKEALSLWGIVGEDIYQKAFDLSLGVSEDGTPILHYGLKDDDLSERVFAQANKRIDFHVETMGTTLVGTTAYQNLRDEQQQFVTDLLKLGEEDLLEKYEGFTDSGEGKFETMLKSVATRPGFEESLGPLWEKEQRGTEGEIDLDWEDDIVDAQLELIRMGSQAAGTVVPINAVKNQRFLEALDQFRHSMQVLDTMLAAAAEALPTRHNR